MEIKVIDDRFVTIDGQVLDARGLDELLRELLEARSSILPTVPVSAKDAGTVFTIDNGAFAVQARGTLVDLLLRHDGAGWFVMTFDQEKAAALAKDFARCAAAAR